MAAFQEIYDEYGKPVYRFLLSLSVNQFRGMGVALTNLDDILLARRFVTALSEGDYEKAVDMMDYSALYQDIREVQVFSAENYLENTERVQIGEEIWYLDKTLARELGDETDAMNIWSDLIWNRHWGIMVPEEIMQEVMVREGIVQENTANGYAVSYSNIFKRLETPWGTYLVDNGAFQSFVQGDRENVDYALYFGIIPEAMYLDIQADIQAYAEKIVAANEDYYGKVWDMTEAEFTSDMRTQYLEKLETVFAQGIEISDIRFYNAYLLGDGKWTVDIQVNVSKGDQRQEMHIRPDTMRGGRIWRVGWSYVQNHSWQEELMDALSFSYEN